MSNLQDACRHNVNPATGPCEDCRSETTNVHKLITEVEALAPLQIVEFAHVLISEATKKLEAERDSLREQLDRVKKWHAAETTRAVKAEGEAWLTNQKNVKLKGLVGELRTAGVAALTSWDRWQNSVEQIIKRPLIYSGWGELETLRAALAHVEEVMGDEP